MYHGLRIYVAILLSALVAFGSPATSSLRVMKDAVGQVVLCTGTGPIAVYVDADGQPVDAPHECSDTALLAFGLDGDTTEFPTPQAASSAAVARPFVALAPVMDVLRQPARGPPSTV